MNDVDWLIERRPHTDEPSPDATAQARRALLEHATRRHPSPARLAGIKRRRRILAGAALAAAAGIAAVAMLPANEARSPLVPRPPAAQAAPLIRLAAHITAAPKPTGDATLVLRSHHFPTGHDFTGADLYLDDGGYYYGPTLADLKRNAAADPSDDEGYAAAKAERQAALDANSLPPAQARQAMIDATYAPGTQASAEAAPPSPALAKKRALAKKGGWTAEKISPRSLDNNRVWLGAMDMLIAGAGDPQVRSGVMKLIATMPEVKVEQGDGVLNLRQTDFPRGYQETLTVDDRTGVITRMTGGTAGQAPDVTVDYDIKRVTAADVIG